MTIPPFSFATAGRIQFGEGASGALPKEAAALGSSMLVVRGRGRNRILPLLDSMAASSLRLTEIEIVGEPTVALVMDACRSLAGLSLDGVVAIGGGSVLDMGKAVAALLTNPGDPFTYLEVVGQGRPLPMPPLPVIAVPTTAGTGSEVTRNAVLAVPERQVKVSLRHPLLYPRVALVDPLLTHSLPPRETALAGLDALTQVIEPYLSCRANPLIDALCLDAIGRGTRALPRACRDGSDHQARSAMAYVALIGGMALANAGLGAVHGFAGPIGGMFQAPHGGICAALLPHVFAANLRALDRRAPDSPLRAKMQAVAGLLTGRPEADPEAGVTALRALVSDLAVPPLTSYGIAPGQVPQIVANARASSSMQGNPLPLTDTELTALLLDALA